MLVDLYKLHAEDGLTRFLLVIYIALAIIEIFFLTFFWFPPKDLAVCINLIIPLGLEPQAHNLMGNAGLLISFMQRTISYNSNILFSFSSFLGFGNMYKTNYNHILPAPAPQCCWASYQFHAEDGLTRFLLQISCPRPARCPQPPPPG